MKTRDPDRACILARRLASRWDAEAMDMRPISHLTIEQRSRIFREALEDELALATAHLLDGEALEPAREERRARIYAAGYRDARARIVAGSKEPAADHLSGLAPEERDAARLACRMFIDEHDLRYAARDTLQKLGLPSAQALIRDVMLTLLGGKIEAQDRSGLIARSELVEMLDPAACLLDDEFVKALRAPAAPASAHTSSATSTCAPASAETEQVGPNSSNDKPTLDGANRLFANRDERRFSEVIGEIIQLKRAAGEWSVDFGDQNRLLSVFAWLTGDKPLYQYTQADIDEFEIAYDATPSGFPWAKYLKAKPQPDWAVVKSAIKGPVKRRSAKTFNRDIGVIHGACTVLAKTAWKPAEGKEPVLNIGKRKRVVDVADEDDLRAPWTEIELKTLFNLPLYTGNCGYKARLKASTVGEVWQDAAYWLPLLAAYTGGCREELAGLELADVHVDFVIPHIQVRNNLTRSKDGVTPAGQKAKSRRRHLPLHRELLRLGFADYVRAIAAEGHTKLFPELYLIKTGGGRFFYARAWNYIRDAVDAVTPLQRNYVDKAADFHSIRTYSGSVMADIDSKQDIIDRILGHKSTSMHAKHYLKLMRVRGIEFALREMKTLIERTFPVVTDHLQPRPVALLPLKQRSRTGSAKQCVAEQLAGT